MTTFERIIFFSIIITVISSLQFEVYKIFRNYLLRKEPEKKTVNYFSRMLFLVFLIPYILLFFTTYDSALFPGWMNTIINEYLLTKEIDISQSEIKIPLPDVSQKEDYSCGASALESLLNYYGKGSIKEKKVIKLLDMDDDGIEPYQIRKLLKRVHINYVEYKLMTMKQLIKCLNKNIPVMMMIQAWHYEKGYYDYRKEFNDGHWVIAIGYDNKNIYFEDPSLITLRGYIERDSLFSRWHDVEHLSQKNNRNYHTYFYGIAIWSNVKLNSNSSNSILKAIRIP